MKHVVADNYLLPVSCPRLAGVDDDGQWQLKCAGWQFVSGLMGEVELSCMSACSCGGHRDTGDSNNGDDDSCNGNDDKNDYGDNESSAKNNESNSYSNNTAATTTTVEVVVVAAAAVF